MRVLALTRFDRLGAGSRVRFFQYFHYLHAVGIKVDAAPFLDDGYLQDLYAGRPRRLGSILAAYARRLAQMVKSGSYDVLWIEKEIVPWIPAWAEAMLLRANIPYIVDYDDAIFHRYDMHKWRLVRVVLGRKIDAVIRGAALVVVGNEYLAERARRAGARRVALVPSVVDLERYPTAPSDDNRVFTVGWIGSPSTARYLQLVVPALRAVCGCEQGRLVVVGSGPLRMEGVPLEVRLWKEETEAREIHGFDVGIMPLEDGPWERGKCGYKLIQYMACGLPVVASPVGANKTIVEHGVDGFLATSAWEWAEALRVLRGDPVLRRKMGDAGRAKVETRYCLQVTAPQMATLLASVAG